MDFLNTSNYLPKFTSKDYTQKEIQFVNLICDYNNTIENAYRIAYNKTPKQAAKRAFIIIKQPHIEELIFLKRKQVFENSNINFLSQIQKLEDIRYLAMQQGKLDIAIKAIDKINNMLGLNTQKIETPNSQQIIINYIEPTQSNNIIDITESNDN